VSGWGGRACARPPESGFAPVIDDIQASTLNRLEDAVLIEFFAAAGADLMR
jgi:hypothetical protein